MEIQIQSCTPSISYTADDSGYLNHSGGSLTTNGVTQTEGTVISHKHSWRSSPLSPQPVSSLSPNDSGVPASPTFEIRQTLSLYDDFEDTPLSGISGQGELSDTCRKIGTVNDDSKNLFDSGIADLSSTFEISSPILKPVAGQSNEKRKCSSTFGKNERTSPKRKPYPTALATYFLSDTEPDSSAPKYPTENNIPRTCLIGKSCVDFLSELGKKMDFSLVVSKIFSYLPPEDLCSVSLVSSTWYKVCCKDRIANKKRRQYIRWKKFNLENLYSENNLKQTPSNRSQFSSGNGVLSQLQNLGVRPISSSTPRSPPVSPTKVRFHLFYKEGGKLASGEQLGRCPRCSLPAHMKPSLHHGVCSRKGCQFSFCIRCQCNFHGLTPCHTTLLPGTKTGVVGSKRSRRNLRKLL